MSIDYANKRSDMNKMKLADNAEELEASNSLLNSCSDLEVRCVTEADVEAIGKFARSIWEQTYTDIISQPQIDYMLEQRYNAERIRKELQTPGYWWDQAFIGGERVGYCASTLSGESGELLLDKLYVYPAHQRRGVGGVLIDHAIAHGRECGCTVLLLAVNKQNTNAIAAYKKYGFVLHGAVLVDIGGGFVQDDFIMTKLIL